MSHKYGQLPVNPNSNRNRVPQGAELASLRATASHLQSVIDHNTQAAKTALERYQEIKARYDAQVLILEEIGSELHTAKLSADALEEHASLLEPKLQEIQGLMNPIRRYSDDILRLVFEEYVAEFGQDGFLAATLLSHVCQRWRIMALSTPSIWTDIIFQPQPSAGASVSKADAFFDRVKALPTTIHIVINGDSPVCTQNIPFARIYRVPAISNLILSIEGDIEAAFNAINVFPNCHIDRLEITPFTDDPIHFGPFLSNFRSFRKLEIGYLKFGPLNWPVLSPPLSKLEEITIDCAKAVPIVELIALAPELRIVKMDQCHVERNSGGGIDQCTSQNLRHLSIECEGVPWSKIRAPSLVEFQTGLLPGVGDSDGFWDFLSHSHLITDMAFDDPTPEQIALLAGLVPNMSSLIIGCRSTENVSSILVALKGSQLSSPPFPILDYLLLTYNPGDLEVVTLENFIRSRCLFRGHPESTMDDGILRALGLFEIQIRYWGVKLTPSPFLDKYLVKMDSNGFRYRVVGQA